MLSLCCFVVFLVCRHCYCFCLAIQALRKSSEFEMIVGFLVYFVLYFLVLLFLHAFFSWYYGCLWFVIDAVPGNIHMTVSIRSEILTIQIAFYYKFHLRDHIPNI